MLLFTDFNFIYTIRVRLFKIPHSVVLLSLLTNSKNIFFKIVKNILKFSHTKHARTKQ